VRVSTDARVIRANAAKAFGSDAGRGGRSSVPSCRNRGSNSLRIASEIEAGEHDDPLILFEIEQGKWESTQDRSAYAVADKLIEARTVRNVSLDAAYLVEKQTT